MASYLIQCARDYSSSYKLEVYRPARVKPKRGLLEEERMIISFAWTTDAVKAGKKTVTRREWTDVYFRRWVKAYREGRITHDAYDRSPRFGGKKIGDIRLTVEPYRERLRDMPMNDLEAEGGYWNSKSEFIELFGGDPEKEVAVVRFYLLRLTTPEDAQLVLPGLK